jgi:pimeloyl-ACP methyl ester carboxylesterase
MKKTQNIALLILLLGWMGNGMWAQEQKKSMAEMLEYSFPTKTLSLSQDIELAYVDEGKGSETILFLHGLGSYLPAWRKNVSALSKDYRCIALDLPGYGKSSKGPYEGSMLFYADVVMEMADSLGLEGVYLAGHSMGGQISLVTALHYPDRVKGLILAAPAGFEVFSEGEKQWFREVLSPRGVKLTKPDQIRLNLVYNFYNFPREAEFMVDDRVAMRDASDFEGYCYIIPQCVKGMVDQPVFDKLSLIKQPVLVVYGENDNLIPNRFLNGGKTRKIAEAGHAELPNSQLLMVPKTGHFVMFEAAETFNDAVREFLGEQGLKD